MAKNVTFCPFKDCSTKLMSGANHESGCTRILCCVKVTCKSHKCQLLKRKKPRKGRNKKTVAISLNIFFNSSLQKNQR